jgi:hypothetical protein
VSACNIALESRTFDPDTKKINEIFDLEKRITKEAQDKEAEVETGNNVLTNQDLRPVEVRYAAACHDTPPLFTPPSLTHSLTHLHAHSLTHPLTHSLTQSLTHSLT